MSVQKPSPGVVTERYADSPVEATSSQHPYEMGNPDDLPTTSMSYRTYRRRWIGLLQLTLLNIVVSWDWSTFSPVAVSSAQYFNTDITTVNWLSTAFLFSFVVGAPATIYVLNHHGPKGSIVVASILILVGNWIRYGGTKANVFGVVMLGQIIIGLSQPFVLAAPTRYSDMWFTERGRIAATALPSLANPFGSAVASLVDPELISDSSQVPNMVLYIAIIATVAALLTFIVPAQPPTPPSAVASTRRPGFTLKTILSLLRNPTFQILLWPFTIYVTAFNSFATELVNILFPYGFDETEAGIAGALLILVGLAVSAIVSPLLDRLAIRTLALKTIVPIIAAMYLAFIFAPATRSIAAPYAICAVLGITNFVLLPLALELVVETTYPVNPEISSTILWSLGQVGGGIGIIVMDALKGTWKGEPEGNMKSGLVFLAVLAWVVVPLPFLLGWRGLGREKRREAEREALMRRGSGST